MATKTTSLKASTKVVAEKTVLEKKNDAIVSAQALALAAAIKTIDDADQFVKNPSSFAKKKGIDLTSSFVSNLKESLENCELNETLQRQLSDTAANKLLSTLGKVIQGPDAPETDCVHIIPKKLKIVDPTPTPIPIPKKIKTVCTMRQPERIRVVKK